MIKIFKFLLLNRSKKELISKNDSICVQLINLVPSLPLRQNFLELINLARRGVLKIGAVSKLIKLIKFTI